MNILRVCALIISSCLPHQVSASKTIASSRQNRFLSVRHSHLPSLSQHPLGTCWCQRPMAFLFSSCLLHPIQKISLMVKLLLRSSWCVESTFVSFSEQFFNFLEISLENSLTTTLLSNPFLLFLQHVDFSEAVLLNEQLSPITAFPSRGWESNAQGQSASVQQQGPH